VFQAGEGAGRSGSIFFFSHDDRFIVKTMSTGELELFCRILPKYADYLEKNPRSLLAKILGVFTIR